MVYWLVRMVRVARTRRAFGFGSVLALVALSILGNSACYYAFDRRLKPDIGVGDALWYSIISVTTIGYGDHSAESTGARLGTVVFTVLLGLSSFTVFLGLVIDQVTQLALKAQRGMGTVMTTSHCLIVNFPSASRVKQVIEELRSDVGHQGREIVVVTDQVDQLPFSYEDVLFVYGSPLEIETFDRARLAEARTAIVLATSYNDPRSDAEVASTVAVINSRNLDAHVVAECLDERHRLLFQSVQCDAIVLGQKIAGNLLVQELNDPGVSQMVGEITSNLIGSTLYSTPVSEPLVDAPYGELAKSLLDRGVNLLCVVRGEQTYTSFMQERPKVGDRILYIGDRRRHWAELRTEDVPDLPSTRGPDRPTQDPPRDARRKGAPQKRRRGR